MRTFSPEFKEQLVKKLLMADGPSVAALSAESGVGRSTLQRWRQQYRRHGGVASGGRLPAAGNKHRLQAVIATAAMNEAERSAWCRERGLYVRELDAWRQAFETADLSGGGDCRAELVRERNSRHALERELLRKERALAEAAALLTLSKKARAIWGVPGEG